MAWTAPATVTTGQQMTAAFWNTQVRDNLLEAAPAKVTTAGDLTYATAANALARLGIGAVNQVLVGGASAPAWASEIGSAAGTGELQVAGSIPRMGIRDTDQADANDRWDIIGADNDVRLGYWDDSGSAYDDSLRLVKGDFLLHSGVNGQGEGAVVIATDTDATPAALTTTGATLLSASITTGGAAYVEGFWMVQVQRTDATSVSQVQILPREDGNNLSSHFSYSGTGIADIIPAVDDIHTFGGMFWRRLTATDTSAYQIFIVADTNSRFQSNRAHLFVRSIQYPT